MLGGLEGKSNSNSVLSFWVQIKEWLNSMLMWIIEKIPYNSTSFTSYNLSNNCNTYDRYFKLIKVGKQVIFLDFYKNS